MPVRRSPRAGAVALHAGDGVEQIERRTDDEIEVEEHVGEFVVVASDGEMPCQAVAAVDEPEEVFDAEGQGHHAVRLGLGEVGDEIVFAEFVRDLEIAEAYGVERGLLDVVPEIGGCNAERLQFVGDPHGPEDLRGSLHGGILQDGDARRPGIQKDFRRLDDETRIHGLRIVGFPPCEQVRFQHHGSAGDTARRLDLRLQDVFQRRTQVPRRIIGAGRERQPDLVPLFGRYLLFSHRISSVMSAMSSGFSVHSGLWPGMNAAMRPPHGVVARYACG